MVIYLIGYLSIVSVFTLKNKTKIEYFKTEGTVIDKKKYNKYI
jgi:hypothetical protein